MFVKVRGPDWAGFVVMFGGCVWVKLIMLGGCVWVELVVMLVGRVWGMMLVLL